MDRQGTMHDGIYDRLHELNAKRQVWRERRQAMEARPGGKHWRGRLRGHLYHTARHLHDALRPTPPFRWAARRALRLELTELTFGFPDLPRSVRRLPSASPD